MALYGVPGMSPEGFERTYLNQNQDAGWWRYLLDRGIGQGNTPLSDYGRRQQSRYVNAYGAYAAQNPNLGFYDYLEQNQPDIQDEFMQQTPSQRNDFGSVRFAPRVRYTRLS